MSALSVKRGFGKLLLFYSFPFEKLIFVAQKICCSFQIEVRPDTCHNNRRTDRPGYIICRTQFEATLFVFHLSTGRQEYDRYITRTCVALKLPTYFVTVHTRHRDVEENQIRRIVRPGDPKRLCTVGGNFDIVPVTENTVY